MKPGLALLVSFAALVSPAFGSSRQESALQRARAALGAPASKTDMLVGEGRAHAMGVEGELEVALTTTGRFRIAFDSVLPDSAGFDGKTVWLRDYTGIERPLELEEADRRKVFAWVLSGHWLEADELELSETATGGSASTVTLHLAGTPLEMTVALDPRTGLTSELAYEADSGRVRWSFADYREVGGRRLPHRWTFDAGAGVERYEVDSYRPRPVDEALFRPHYARPADVEFDPAVDAELEVVRASSGHLLVRPLVEGEDLGCFVFDTGAGAMVIDRRVADELGYESIGATLAVGVAATTTTSYRRGELFQLGPLTWRDPIYGDVDMGFARSTGQKIVGIIGYDLIARCVVEVEPAAGRIRLHDPAHFDGRGLPWQDLVLQNNLPCAEARFEGERRGLFRLDTGASGTLTFHAPAVDALHLLDGRKLETGQSSGVGGSAATSEGELAWFELGGHRFEKPRVSFSHAEAGTFTDPYTLGNIGQTFLKPFRIVLDYPHDRLAFVLLEK